MNDDDRPDDEEYEAARAVDAAVDLELERQRWIEP